MKWYEIAILVLVILMLCSCTSKTVVTKPHSFTLSDRAFVMKVSGPPIEPPPPNLKFILTEPSYDEDEAFLIWYDKKEHKMRILKIR